MAAYATQQQPEGQALEAAIRRDYPRLVAFLSNKLGNTADAEDIAQDTFIRLMELVDRGENVRNVQALMFSIARNLCLDLLRRNVRTNRIFASTDMIEMEAVGCEHESDFYNPERTLEGKQYAELIDNSIAHLPGKCKGAFKLAKIDGATYPETARAMNLSVSMIEKHVSRALHKLRSDPFIISAIAA